MFCFKHKKQKQKMADRGRTSRSRTTPWDSNNPANWTADKLKRELEKMCVFVPVSLGKNTLRKIYLENKSRQELHLGKDQ